MTGATGMIGGCVLRICLENPDVSRVTVSGRSRPRCLTDVIRSHPGQEPTDLGCGLAVQQNKSDSTQGQTMKENYNAISRST